MAQKISIYVQHVMGAGHLVRAMSLAEALSQCGHQVLLISGGFPIDREVVAYEYFQLPPTRAIESNFTKLVDDRGQLIDDRWRDNRRDLLLSTVSEFNPDLVITETFPFGRRIFHFELEPLMYWVKQQANMYLMASIRDVLQRRSEPKNRFTVEVVNKYYDGVLVHADERLFKLDASFMHTDKIEDKLFYTGYIHDAVDAPPDDGSSVGRNEIIVSGGSGTVSAQLMAVAPLARPLSKARSYHWRMMTGRDQSKPAYNPEPGLTIEPNRDDFYALLGRCALSVSLAGYNTTLDVLASGVRSVMVPFVGSHETEQSDRAQALERAGRIIQVPENILSPKSLAQAIDCALEMAPVQIDVNMHGAGISAQIVTEKLQQWQAAA